MQKVSGVAGFWCKKCLASRVPGAKVVSYKRCFVQKVSDVKVALI